MSRRHRTPEAAVVAFFTESEPVIALTLYHAVRAILDARGVFKVATRTKPPRVRRLKGEVPLPIDGEAALPTA
jgi:hypothetical protein